MISPTQLLCPDAPVSNYTHHMVPRGNSNRPSPLVCAYCGKTTKEIVESQE